MIITGFISQLATSIELIIQEQIGNLKQKPYQDLMDVPYFIRVVEFWVVVRPLTA